MSTNSTLEEISEVQLIKQNGLIGNCSQDTSLHEDGTKVDKADLPPIINSISPRSTSASSVDLKMDPSFPKATIPCDNSRHSLLMSEPSNSQAAGSPQPPAVIIKLTKETQMPTKKQQNLESIVGQNIPDTEPSTDSDHKKSSPCTNTVINKELVDKHINIGDRMFSFSIDSSPPMAYCDTPDTGTALMPNHEVDKTIAKLEDTIDRASELTSQAPLFSQSPIERVEESSPVSKKYSMRSMLNPTSTLNYTTAKSITQQKMTLIQQQQQQQQHQQQARPKKSESSSHLSKTDSCTRIQQATLSNQSPRVFLNSGIAETNGCFALTSPQLPFPIQMKYIESNKSPSLKEMGAMKSKIISKCKMTAQLFSSFMKQRDTFPCPIAHTNKHPTVNTYNQPTDNQPTVDSDKHHTVNTYNQPTDKQPTVNSDKHPTVNTYNQPTDKQPTVDSEKQPTANIDMQHTDHLDKQPTFISGKQTGTQTILMSDKQPFPNTDKKPTAISDEQPTLTNMELDLSLSSQFSAFSSSKSKSALTQDDFFSVPVSQKTSYRTAEMSQYKRDNLTKKNASLRRRKALEFTTGKHKHSIVAARESSHSFDQQVETSAFEDLTSAYNESEDAQTSFTVFQYLFDPEVKDRFINDESKTPVIDWLQTMTNHKTSPTNGNGGDLAHLLFSAGGDVATPHLLKTSEASLPCFLTPASPLSMFSNVTTPLGTDHSDMHSWNTDVEIRQDLGDEKCLRQKCGYGTVPAREQKQVEEAGNELDTSGIKQSQPPTIKIKDASFQDIRKQKPMARRPSQVGWRRLKGSEKAETKKKKNKKKKKVVEPKSKNVLDKGKRDTSVPRRALSPRTKQPVPKQQDRRDGGSWRRFRRVKKKLITSIISERPELYYSNRKRKWMMSPTRKRHEVRKMTSEATSRWPMKSLIPLLTYVQLRSRLDILMGHRRCLDYLTNQSRPSNIPVTSSFMTTLRVAAHEEWTMHEWTHSFIDERLYDCEDESEHSSSYQQTTLMVHPILTWAKRKLIVLFRLVGAWLAFSTGIVYLCNDLLMCKPVKDDNYHCLDSDVTCIRNKMSSWRELEDERV